MPADSKTRDHLKEIRERLAQARSERATARKELDSAREAFGEADFANDVKITETTEFREAQNAAETWGNLGDQITQLESDEREVRRVLGAVAPQGESPGNSAALAHPASNWDGRRLLAASEGYAHAKESGLFNSRQKFGTVEIGQVATRETAMSFLSGQGILGASLPGAPAGDVTVATGSYVPPDYRGVLAPRLRQLTLLDIIPTGTTDSNSVEYVQLTAVPFGAAETAELALKPQLGLTTNDATASVRTIAGFIKASRQSLNDVAGLATLINTLLPYEIRRRVEAQILAGDGVGQNILGILNTTGIGAPPAVAGDNVADAVLRAMTTIILSDSDPDFVAMNPLDWQSLLLMRSDVGGANTGQYLYGTPGTLATPTLWGMTITPSRIIPQGSPLVGDSMGCTILVNEGVNIRTSDSDQDDFIRNRVTVLAETRIAFPVWRPTAFTVAAVD